MEALILTWFGTFTNGGILWLLQALSASIDRRRSAGFHQGTLEERERYKLVNAQERVSSYRIVKITLLSFAPT